MGEGERERNKRQCLRRGIERLRTFPSLHLFCISSCLLLSKFSLSAFPGWDTIKRIYTFTKTGQFKSPFLHFWIWILQHLNWLLFFEFEICCIMGTTLVSKHGPHSWFFSKLVSRFLIIFVSLTHYNLSFFVFGFWWQFLRFDMLWLFFNFYISKEAWSSQVKGDFNVSHACLCVSCYIARNILRWCHWCRRWSTL